MPLPNELPKLNFEGVDPVFQQWLNQLTDTVNTHSGYNGPTQFASHLDLSGNRIQNVGAPVDATDAVSSGVATSKYGAAAIKPQLESGGSQSLVSYRQMNNGTQREQISSWLNDLMSTPPSANGILPTLTNVMGGVQVNIPASTLKFADGTVQQLQSFTDNIPFATSYTISSISATAGIVTVVLTAPSGLVGGGYITVGGVTPNGFNGAFQILNSSGGGTTLTTNSPCATALRYVAWATLQPKASTGPAKATIVIQLFGATFGCASGSSVVTSTI